MQYWNPYLWQKDNRNSHEISWEFFCCVKLSNYIIPFLQTEFAFFCKLWYPIDKGVSLYEIHWLSFIRL